MAIIESVVGIMTSLWNSTVAFAPNLVGALIILVLGYVIGRILGGATKRLLTRLEVEKHIQQKGHLKLEVTSIFDVIVRWIIYLAFIQAASETLGIASLVYFVGQVLSFLPGLLWASIVILVTYLLGNYIKEQVIASETIYADLVGKVVLFLMIYLGIALALPFVGIDATLINNILLIIIASVGIGVAIAVGFGLKDMVEDLFKDYAQEFKKKRK
jgi:membrane protein DedA with SNARE-associated domain